jgi:hypothetical protein
MKLWLRFAALWISLGGIGLAVAFFASPGGLTLLSGVLIVLVAGTGMTTLIFHSFTALSGDSGGDASSIENISTKTVSQR